MVVAIFGISNKRQVGNSRVRNERFLDEATETKWRNSL